MPLSELFSYTAAGNTFGEGVDEDDNVGGVPLTGLLEKRIFIRPFLVSSRFEMIMTYICACLFSVLSIIGVVDEWTTEMDNEAYEVLQSSRLVFYLLLLTIRNSNAFLKLKRPISSH